MPLDDLAVEALYQRLQTPTAGRDLVRERRRGGPVRRVRGGRSVMSRFASRKNAETRQCESRTLEAPACTLYEHLGDVLAYYDQPCTLTLDYAPVGSARKTTRHTPDFLVIRDREIALEEWKPEETLRERAISEPSRYVQDADGEWHQPAAERVAEEMGLVYRVRTERHLPELLVRNWRLLAPHVGVAVSDPSGVIQYVRDAPGATIAELLERVPDANISKVLALAAAGIIWVDLERTLLTNHDQAQLFENEERGRLLQKPIALVPTGAVSLASGGALLWSGVPWTVANAGLEMISLVDAAGQVRTLRREAVLDLIRIGELRMAGATVVERADLLKDVPGEYLDIATQRLEALRPYLEHGLAPRTRTHQRWLARYNEARSTRGDGLLGLVPSYGAADHERRVAPQALECAHAVIKEVVITPERRPYHSGYKIYVGRCEAAGIKPVSQPTYRAEIARLTTNRSIRRRLGRKVANALQVPRPISPFPVHGDRAFERVHIDHTLLDVTLRDSLNGDELGRAWLTLAIDAYTRRIVGHVLTFAPPSAATVMLALRDIVARYQRLPAVLILDNGSEFRSSYLQMTAAAFAVTLDYRPPMDPRFGSVIETCFGKLNRDLIHFLRGNTVGRKDVRSQDPEHDASHLAIWTLPALEDNLSAYFYKVYDEMRSPSLGLSARERFEQSVREAGVSERETITDDFDFRVMTAPAIPQQVRVGRQGVKAKRMRYWCEAFARPAARGAIVDVRWEPFNRAVAYAFVEGTWHLCHAAHSHLLQNRTERELRLASIELTQRLKRTPSTRELAEHLESTLRTETELLERQRVLETLRASAGLGAGVSSSVVLVPAAAPVAQAPDPVDEGEPEELEEWKEPAA